MFFFRFWKEQEEWIVEKLSVEADSKYELLMTVNSGNLLGIVIVMLELFKISLKSEPRLFWKKNIKVQFPVAQNGVIFVLFSSWKFLDTFLV